MNTRLTVFAIYLTIILGSVSFGEDEKKPSGTEATNKQEPLQKGLRLFRRVTFDKTEIDNVTTQDDINATVYSRKTATQTLAKDTSGNAVLRISGAVAKKYPGVRFKMYFVSEDLVSFNRVKTVIGEPEKVRDESVKVGADAVTVSWKQYGMVDFGVVRGNVLLIRSSSQGPKNGQDEK